MTASSENPKFVSRRRTLAKFGCVNFPVHDARWRNSGEGGMFVKLVMVDERAYERSDWTICCGVGVTDMLTESWVADDQQAQPPGPELSDAGSAQEYLQALHQHEQAHRQWQERMFPRLHDEAEPGVERYLSRSLLANMVLGNTGWSGYDEKAGQYWHCTRDDLTEEGKALYEQVRKLYPGCRLHLLTFLDT